MPPEEGFTGVEGAVVGIIAGSFVVGGVVSPEIGDVGGMVVGGVVVGGVVVGGGTQVV